MRIIIETTEQGGISVKPESGQVFMEQQKSEGQVMEPPMDAGPPSDELIKSLTEASMESGAEEMQAAQEEEEEYLTAVEEPKEPSSFH